MEESESTSIATMAVPLPAVQRLLTRHDSALDTSSRRYGALGALIVVLFFGVLGGWAMTAPLNGAVVSNNAMIKVDGNRKSIQHLDGGIVRELRIKEGDHVNAGDTLIELDDTQARSEYQVYSQQQQLLRATEARLIAELNLEATVTPPPDLAARLSDPDIAKIWNSQVRQFEKRRDALVAAHKVIEEKIHQLEAQIAGSEEQVAAYQRQSDSAQKELDLIGPLAEQGLVTQPRKLQLERSLFGLAGQIGEAKANIARFRQAIAEQTQQASQIDGDWLAAAAKELRDTQGLLLEVTPRLFNAQAVLNRTIIRSPYTGKVVGLSVFAVGAVIQRGDKILDVVPDDNKLTVEAEIPVDAISDVHPGMAADVHLTAYKQRITPTVPGKVTQVSADRLTDNRTGTPYYTAVVQIDENELAALPEVNLYPGMPANVTIPTVARTAFDYLIGPLAMSFNAAFRQR